MKKISKQNIHYFLTKKWVMVSSCILFLCVFGFTIFYLYMQTNQAFAANFADNILRPLIGNTSTIQLESLLFKAEDHVNQIKYSFVKPDAKIFSAKGNLPNTQNTQLETATIPPLTSLPPIPGEGVWSEVNTGTKDALMQKTFVRPDSERSYAIVALVKMNMQKLSLMAVAGKREPGGALKPGPGIIPKEVRESNKLIAAFNGGFQQKDGHYGMIVGSTIYQPLRLNLATLVIYSSNPPQIISYSKQNLGNGIAAIRQNGPLLLENSKIVTSSEAWNMQTWGLTTTNSMYTWRSGIGITKNGNLIYAAGPSLIPETLAEALKSAGAINAMQLDINSSWVRFVVFDSLGFGKYSYYSLTKSMLNGGYQYLNGYQKDFFYVVKK